MTHREGILVSGRSAAVGSALTVAFFFIGGVIYSTLPRESREVVATVFTLLIVAAGFMTVSALLILISELLGSREDVRLTDRGIPSAAQAERYCPTTAPTFTPAKPTAEDVSAELLRNALAKRDEAFRESERIARVLHLIEQEISK